jgi:nitrate reductase gamma subunit
VDLIFPILLALIALIGVWMFISPGQYVFWIKSARPSLGLREDDQRALATARFIGACSAAFSILVLVAFVFERYRK